MKSGSLANGFFLKPFDIGFLFLVMNSVRRLDSMACYEHDHRLVTSLQIQTTPPQIPDLHGFFIRL